MPLRAGGRACVNCGDPVSGSSDLCADCTPGAPPGERVASCPYCKAATPWEKMGRLKRNHGDGRVEALYFCPSCRGVVEAASWMER